MKMDQIAIASLNDSNEKNDSDEIINNLRKVSRLLSDDDDQIQDGQEEQPAALSNDTSGHSVDINESNTGTTAAAKPNKVSSSIFSSDIFDAEEESDFEISTRAAHNMLTNKEQKDENIEDDSNNEIPEESRQNEDEGFAEESDDDNVSLSSKLKARLKKGASKKASREGAPRKSKTIAMELHSETQRIVRDSRVRLPYHQPETKSLDEFLSHAREKRKLLQQAGGAAAFRNLSWYEENQKMRNQRKALDEAARCEESKSTGQSEQGSSREVVSGDVIDSEENKNVEITEDGIRMNDRGTLSGRSTKDDLAVTESKKISDTSKTCEYGNSRLHVDSSTNIGKCPENFDDDELPDLVIDTDVVKQTGTVKRIYENGEGVDGATDVVDDDVGSLFVKGKCLDDDCTRRDSPADKLRLFIEETQSDDETESRIGRNSLTNNTDEASTDGGCVDSTKVEGDLEGVESPVITSVLQQNGTTSYINGVSGCDTNVRPTTDSVSAVLTPTVLSKTTSHLTPKLASLSIPNITPQLTGGKNGFIDLGEPVECPPQDPKMVEFMNRFLNQTKKRRVPSGGKDVTISIVEKATNGENDTQLKLSTVTYHDPEVVGVTPGSKLDSLKQGLQAEMRVKREAARRKRVEMYDLDNEVGEFRDEEEEEAEMTDGEESEDGEWAEEEIDEECNEYVDDEASDEGDEDGGDEDTGDDEDNMDDDVNGGEVKLQLELSDGDDDSDENMKEDDEVVSFKKKKSCAVLLSDDEEDDEDSVRPSPPDIIARLDTEMDRESLTRLLAPDPETKSTTTDMDTSRCESSMSEVSDLGNRSFGELTPVSRLMASQRKMKSSVAVDSSKSSSQGVSRLSVGSLDDAQQASRDLFDIAKPSSNSDDMDELLGLCSGRFPTQAPLTGADSRRTSRALFDESSTQGMSQLLGLCSGTFPVDNSTSQEAFDLSQKRNKRKLSEEGDNENDDNRDKDDEDTFVVMSQKMECEIVDDEDEDERSNLSEEEEKITFSNFTSKKGKILADFVENEAELSGSEFGSEDENEEDGEYEDVLQTELGDRDVKLSEDQLRNQVGRVHQKQVLDEDERDVLRLQEMYLPDGDLYSEGAGRQRRFKWSSMDDSSQTDMFDKQSDEEDNGGENQEDSKWRMERYEREQWLAEQNKDNGEEDSQFVKFGQSFLVRETRKPGKENDKKLASSKLAMKGSFLARGKDTLSKIAKMTKPSAQSNISSKSSLNCVFVTKSPEAPEKKDKTLKNSSQPANRSGPRAKKARITPAAATPRESVFNHL